MSAPAHIFRAASGARRGERVVFWLFRAATWFVLICGAAVFLNIFVKGSRTVFKAEAPFINTTFLTEAPESLYLFEWQGNAQR